MESVDPGLGIEIMYAGLFALVDDLGLDDVQIGHLLADAEKVHSGVLLAVAALPGGRGPTARAGQHRRTGQRYLTDADLLPDLTRRVRSPQRPVAAPKSRKAARKLLPAPEPVTVAGRHLRALALHHQSARGVAGGGWAVSS